MKEIRILKEDQLQKLYEEVIREFLRREQKMNEDLNLKAAYPIDSLDCDRGIGDEDEDICKNWIRYEFY